MDNVGEKKAVWFLLSVMFLLSGLLVTWQTVYPVFFLSVKVLISIHGRINIYLGYVRYNRYPH